jgi:chemotaxis protein CheC
MTIEHVTALTELERDALGEIANIAMARAATSLRQMVEHQVLLSVPAVEILSQEAAAQVVGTADNRSLVAVRQDFNGAFSGRALLIFPETNAWSWCGPSSGGRSRWKISSISKTKRWRKPATSY